MRIQKALIAAILSAGLCLAQQGSTPTPEKVAAAAENTAGVYGTIKEVKRGARIVIAVDNAKDRTYSLSDSKKRVTLAEDLAIGDKVKIVESGKDDDKTIQIVRDTRNSAGQTGERARTGEQKK